MRRTSPLHGCIQFCAYAHQLANRGPLSVLLFRVYRRIYIRFAFGHGPLYIRAFYRTLLHTTFHDFHPRFSLTYPRGKWQQASRALSLANSSRLYAECTVADQRRKESISPPCKTSPMGAYVRSWNQQRLGKQPCSLVQRMAPGILLIKRVSALQPSLPFPHKTFLRNDRPQDNAPMIQSLQVFTATFAKRCPAIDPAEIRRSFLLSLPGRRLEPLVKSPWKTSIGECRKCPSIMRRGARRRMGSRNEQAFTGEEAPLSR